MKIIFRFLFVLSAVLLGVVFQPARKSNAAPPPARWKFSPFANSKSFPIAVWLQSPENATQYKSLGINLYIGLWEGPTEAQLARLKDAEMHVICEQNPVGLAHKDDPTIVGWMHGDEPDNAQSVTDPKTGQKGYGPCIPPPTIVAAYQKLRAIDPTRPILLNLGQGVANDEWIGRGSGAKLDDYTTYVQGCDVVSFDVYPVAGLPNPDSENYLWYVPKGVDRLMQWTKGDKPIWCCIEASRIDGGKKVTPHQIRAEVWMALIHGAKGLIYFVHQFKPTFNEHALLNDDELRPAVTALNHQILALAPVLNSPAVPNGATAASSAANVPLSSTVRHYDGDTYLFTAGMRNGSTRGTFHVSGVPANATVEVLGENRSFTLQNGTFTDDFEPFDVHLYRVRKGK